MRYSQLDPDLKQQRRTVVLLLRFRTLRPTPACRRYLTYAQVARVANLGYNSVQHICRWALESRNPVTPRKRFSELSAEHVDYLTNEATLVRQAGLTLAERCAVFKLQYSGVKLSPT